MVTLCTPDFRVFQLGDLDLRNEICLDSRSEKVYRVDGQRVSARKMYSARIHGCKSKMTVGMYKGNKAEEVGLAYPPR
jgi:hypothetical protein